MDIGTVSGAAAEKHKIPRLDRIEFVVVKLPFVTPFGTSVQVWTHKEALLLRVESEGIVAWGECVADPDPFYLPETTQTVRHIVKDFLFPLIEPGVTFEELEVRFRHVRGHGMAKATVENALMNLVALQRGVPLHELLGFPRKRIFSGISIGLHDSIPELLSTVEEAVAKKYHRVKMKVKRGKDLEWVRAVRERFPDLRLMVDANGDYGLEDLPHLQQLDAFNLMMIEQPLSYSDIVQHAELQRVLKTPICLDESILNLADAQAAVNLGACRVLNIKQGRVGGLLESMRIARYAAEKGIDVWSGGMDETGIGRALNIHLQTVAGFSLPGDTSETSRYFTEDIVDPPVVLDPDGYISIPPGPGLGIRIIPERLQKYTIHREGLR